MRRAAAATALLASSLLLTGCDVPTSLEGFTNWREKFFLQVEPSQIQEKLGLIIGTLVVLAMGIALRGVITNLRQGTFFWDGLYAIGIALLVTAGLIVLYIPLSTAIGQAFLPGDLTLDKVFSAMRWELTLDMGGIITAAWGVAFTLILPTISGLWQGVMLVTALFAIAGSIASHSLKGVVFAIAQVMGWVLFLVAYNTLVTLIGTYYPTWDYAPMKVFINAFYTGVTILLQFGSYMVLPWLVTEWLTPIVMPSLYQQANQQTGNSAGEVAEGEKLATESPRRPKRQHGIDLSALIFPFPIPSRRRDGKQPAGGSGPEPEPEHVDGEVVEDEGRPVEAVGVEHQLPGRFLRRLLQAPDRTPPEVITLGPSSAETSPEGEQQPDQVDQTQGQDQGLKSPKVKGQGQSPRAPWHKDRPVVYLPGQRQPTAQPANEDELPEVEPREPDPDWLPPSTPRRHWAESLGDKKGPTAAKTGPTPPVVQPDNNEDLLPGDPKKGGQL